jgi:Na+/H+ antiporter
LETITIVLVLLFAVVASGVASRLLPLPIPLPLVQIVFGGVIGLAGDWRVTLDPVVFFLLLLPPLLFLDGWRIPREKILHDAPAILGLALGLVVLTVLGAGWFIHWLIPTMPLPVAFALAAVISPTDPIAVSAIAQRVPIPDRMMHILEGESLLNDASGLVCLRFAIAAALTGTFSLPGAALDFLWLAMGGLAIGAGLTWVVGRTKNLISRQLGEDSGSQILISLLIPYGAYLLAERLHCSGILAAVAAGLTMSFVEGGGQALATTRLRRSTVWDIIQLVANGIIFVLLGEQLPMILARAGDTVRLAGHQTPWWLAFYVLTITLGLGILRCVWVYLSLRFTLFRRKLAPSTPNWRVVAVMSFAGVRGAITLAGVLTIPLALTNGSLFPARNLAIFLASGVIVTSLVAASLALPWLLAGLQMPPEPSRQIEEDTARIGAAKAAIAEIDQVRHSRAKGSSDADLYVAAAARVMASYRQRIENREGNAEANASSRLSEKIERDLRLAALRAERTELFRMVRRGKLASDLARKLIREVDLVETRDAN